MPEAYDAARMAENVAAIREKMAQAAKSAGRDPDDILLCAVCKTRSCETVRESAALPVDLFGENHMQELVKHFDAGAFLQKPAHFIGHLQTNKVKKVVGRAAVIESVDSLRLLEAVDKEAEKQGLRQEILFELNVGGEITKTGAAAEDLWPLMERAAGLTHVFVRGLMAIPPAFDNGPESRRWFAALRELSERAAGRHYENARMEVLSMGMTDSYLAAIAEGATLVRVGTAIYGPRSYPNQAE